MHCMHIINAILNYKKMQPKLEGRFSDGRDFVSIQSLRGRFHISQRETLFRGRLYFVTLAMHVSGNFNFLCIFYWLRLAGRMSDFESKILADRMSRDF